MTDALPTDLVRPLRADELRAGADLFRGALLGRPLDDRFWARVTAVADAEPDRALGVLEGDTLVATARSFGTRTAVPGGAVLDLAAVTGVGVRADRTRRGLLSALMRAQLDDLVAREEPLAALHATQARIYGRFGYGIATRARALSVRPGRAFRPAVPVGEVHVVDAGSAEPAAVHERLALARPGGIERSPRWWAGAAAMQERDRLLMLAAVHTGAGGPDGFAVAEVRDGSVLAVHDLHAAEPAAAAGLWRFLLGVDLVERVTAVRRPLDEPLELLLADPRDVTVTGLADELWLRLVDVPTALAARSWGAATPLLLGVHDPFLPDNAGVYRIAHGAAERVEPLGGPVAPQLETDVAGLAMAYLGDRRPSELVATGWWTAVDPAAVPEADAAFATDAVPWCGTMF